MNELMLELVQFHFLRPWWLVTIPAALLLVILFWRQKGSALNWGKAINQQLLNYLIEDGAHSLASRNRWPWLLLFVTWTIAALALAGPAWQKLPQPVHQKQDALVIVLDLSLSMYSEDIKPSRLIRARHKVMDILKARNEGLSALIAYSRDAHVVSPLTDDNSTVANLVPALNPQMMPALGSNPRAGIQTAIELLSNTAINEGRILLISDGISEQDAEAIADILEDHNYQLSLMAVATTAGAPIPLSQGYVKDSQGTIVTPQLDRGPFQQLAADAHARYIESSLDDRDIQFLLPKTVDQLDSATTKTERQFDQWQDQGAYLCLLLLPLALLGFRRGWLLALPLLISLQPQSSYALEWQDLWQTKDQQAMQLFQQGDAETAAKTFTDPNWKAAAQYKAQQFEEAAKHYAEQTKQNATAVDYYNYGNALAKAGQLEQAIEQYNKALQQNPEFEDAAFNKQVVEQLNQQQQNQPQQNQDQDQDQDSKNQEQDKNQQQNSDQQNQQNSDQQNSDQQNQSQDQQQNQDNSADPQKDQQQDQEQNAKQDPKEPANKQQQPSQTEQQPSKEQQEQAIKQAAEDETNKQEKATEQWLRQIPDDPSGLLRRKFDYEYRLRRAGEENDEEDQPLW